MLKINKFIIHAVFPKICLCLCLYHSKCVLCLQCKTEFKVICRQPYPNNCMECISQDLCLTCLYTKFNSADIGSYICSSNCEDQCILNRTCLGGCSTLRDLSPNRPVLCLTKDACFKCLQLTGGCLKCNNGMYGSHCDKRCGFCQRDNKGLVACNTNTGECSNVCEDGYFGRRCDIECKHCIPLADSNRCNKLSGRCVNGCISGWFRNTCNETCDNRCLNRSCNRISGSCDSGCVTGWYGDTCEKLCSDKCAKASCDQHTGACNNGCISGWYGYTCENVCTYTCRNRSCDQLSGQCNYGCLSGRYGRTCEKSCPDTCLNGSCDQLLGQCDVGCPNGYHNDMCNKRCSGFCNVSVIDRSIKDDYDETDRNHFTVTSNTDPVVYAASGCLVGVAALLFCGIIIFHLRKYITRCSRNNNLHMSAIESSTPVYDEIALYNHRSYNCDMNDVTSNISRTHLVELARESPINSINVSGHSYQEIQLQMGWNVGEDSESVNYLHPVS